MHASNGCAVFTIVFDRFEVTAQSCNMSSSVRKRAAKDGARSRTSAAPEDAKASQSAETSENSEELTFVPKSDVKDLTNHSKLKGRKRRSGFVFFLGGIFGILVAGFFAQKNDLFEMPEFADLISDLNIAGLMEVLPAGFLQDARELKVSFLVYFMRPSY